MVKTLSHSAGYYFAWMLVSFAIRSLSWQCPGCWSEPVLSVTCSKSLFLHESVWAYSPLFRLSDLCGFMLRILFYLKLNIARGDKYYLFELFYMQPFSLISNLVENVICFPVHTFLSTSRSSYLYLGLRHYSTDQHVCFYVNVS